MTTVNMHEAKTHFSKLVARAKAGETIIVAKAGEPQARLVPIEEPAAPVKRTFGWLRGRFEVPDDIKTPFKAEIEEMFYGDPDRTA